MNHPQTPLGLHTCLLPPQTFRAPESVSRWGLGGSWEEGHLPCKNLPSSPPTHSRDCGVGRPSEQGEELKRNERCNQIKESLTW